MLAAIPVRLAGTSSHLPGPPVTTAELALRLGAGADAAAIAARTGIGARHFAAADSTWSELAAAAIAAALERAELTATDLARIIFVTSSGGDILVPANANAVALHLGLRGTCDCFDLNNACMGFLTAFDLAARSIATGYGVTAIVAVELGSRYITPAEPRPYVVFGDGAAAAILTPSRNGEGILGSWLRNDAGLGGDVTLAHPGVTAQVERVHFNSPNRDMMERAVELIRRSAGEALAQAQMTLGEIDWVLPHQPNGVLLRAVIDALGVPAARVVPIVDRAGSLAAASIPTSLDVLMRSGRLHGGERVLLIGVGAGVSAGAVVLQLP